LKDVTDFWDDFDFFGLLDVARRQQRLQQRKFMHRIVKYNVVSDIDSSDWWCGELQTTLGSMAASTIKLWQWTR
jgi:hypothetical protein